MILYIIQYTVYVYIYTHIYLYIHMYIYIYYVYNLNRHQSSQSSPPGLQALRQDPRAVRAHDDRHWPHRERRGADRALRGGGGQGGGKPWENHGKTIGKP